MSLKASFPYRVYSVFLRCDDQVVRRRGDFLYGSLCSSSPKLSLMCPPMLPRDIALTVGRDQRTNVVRGKPLHGFVYGQVVGYGVVNLVVA